MFNSEPCDARLLCRLASEGDTEGDANNVERIALPVKRTQQMGNRADASPQTASATALQAIQDLYTFAST
jgi:hypothetical protein